MSLNVPASERCSALPSTVARGREVAVGDAPRRAVEPAHRPRDLPGHDRAGEQPEPEHEQPDQREPDPRAADRAVDRLDALRHAHGADRATGRQHRDRRDKQRLAERLGAPLALVEVARPAPP